MMFLYSHNPRSRGAKALARALGMKRIRHKGSKFKGRRDKVVLNWGSSQPPHEVIACTLINPPGSVYRASDKLLCLRTLADRGVSTPAFTKDMEVAKAWTKHGAIVCRTLLRADGGRGVFIADGVEGVVKAPLYTRYVKKSSEWRVHIIGGLVVCTQRKVRNPELDVEDYRIRNHDRGFIFQRHGNEVPASVLRVSHEAIRALDLDFGAVDVVFNKHYEEAYVLEVNTAPGLEGTTLEDYTRGFTIFLEKIYGR